MSEVDRPAIVAQVTEAIAASDDALDRSMVEQVVSEELTHYVDSPGQEMLAVVVERAARRRLRG